MKKNYLVSTALKNTWDLKNKNYFLGMWCKSYERKKILTNIDSVTMEYHWKDRKKLKKDHQYIRSTAEKILKILSSVLNKTHELEEDNKYWRIVIFAWLSHYVSVIFDRWETTRIFIKKNKKKFFYTYKLPIKEYELAAKDHHDYILKARSDEWNHALFCRIISFLKHKKIISKEKKIYHKRMPDYIKGKNIFKNEDKKFILRLFDSILSPIAFNYNEVFFDSFYFPKVEYFKICIKNKFIPARYIDFFNFTINENDTNDNTKRILFKKILDKKKYNDKFLNFLLTNLHKDLPEIYLENFMNLKKKVSKLAKKKRIIFSMHSIFYNDNFKTFVAESKKKGTKFIFSDHGGGFTSKLDSFLNYTDKISDEVIRYDNTIKKKNYINLSPTLPIVKTRLLVRTKNYCTIVFIEGPRYLFKPQPGPTMEESLENFGNLLNFVKNLPLKIKSKIKFRSKTNFEFNSSKRFADVFGHKCIDNSSTSSYYDAISKSKLMIVTYPQTTFSESLYLNVPTILICKKEHYMFTKPSLKMFNYLKRNKIAFENFYEANLHVSKHWDKIDVWWNNKNVQKARKNYLKNFFNIKENWYDEWSNYINLQKTL